VSRFVGEFVRREVGRDTTVVPVPVDVDAFRLNRERDHLRPVILCAASLEDERKGGNLLMRAFNEIKRRRPEAQLSISCSLGDSKRAELLSLVAPEWRRDVHVLGAGLHQDLPQLFGRAAVSVLPSRWEGFGMVLLESMATGTPVVGTREGAIPELIDSDDVGRLFDPGPSNGSAPSNVEGCVRALLEALDLSRDPATATRCRAKAEGYSWSRVGPRYEEIYRNLVRERAQAGGRVTEP
jgi:phosphatidylinositol alpha-mannosyltransferase